MSRGELVMETSTWLFSILVFFVPLFGLMVALLILAIRRGGPGRWPVVIGFGWAAGLLIILAIAAFGFHWGQSLSTQAMPHPKNPDTGIYEFCEGYQPQVAYETGTVGPSHPNDPIAQPQSVMADLGFMAAGLFVLYLFSAARRGVPDNPMVDARSLNPRKSSSWYPMGLGLLIIAMGPASMLYHATITAWGGWFDAMSIIVWMIFSLCYSVQQLIRRPWTWIAFIVALGVLATVMGGVVTIKNFPSVAAYLVFGLSWGFLELAVVIRAARVHKPINGVVRDWRWFVALLSVFLGSMLFFWIFSGGSPLVKLCAGPYSLYQAHAWYHMLSGVVTLLGYVYFASETRPIPVAKTISPSPA